MYQGERKSDRRPPLLKLLTDIGRLYRLQSVIIRRIARSKGQLRQLGVRLGDLLEQQRQHGRPKLKITGSALLLRGRPFSTLLNDFCYNCALKHKRTERQNGAANAPRSGSPCAGLPAVRALLRSQRQRQAAAAAGCRPCS